MNLVCPKCRNSVSAADYFTSAGHSDWRVESVGVRISCNRCGYSGLPIELETQAAGKGKKRGKR